MAINKIDSNITGLRYAEEASIGVLPTPAQIWYPLEPNEYGDFGGQVTTVARNPINPSRQRKKGVATDLDASGGFTTDLTQTNLERLMRGFFFADFREKPDTKAYSAEATYNADGSLDVANSQITISAVDGINEGYETAGDFTADPAGFIVGHLIFASGFGTAANNGLKRVTAVSATEVTVAEDLTTEASPPSDARLVAVGFQFQAGDLDVDASSGFAKFTTTTQDLTALGLIPGEWIYVGGDSAGTSFSNAVNNGFKRIRSISANEMVVDKSDQDMVTETSTTETIQIFFGRVIKNENTSTFIKRRSYQLERTLGANNDADLTLEQAEYLPGSIPNELTINIPTAQKVTVDVAFVATDSETIDENVSGANTLRSKVGTATKLAIEEEDAFNTSSDVARIALSRVKDGDEAPEALFAFLQELTLTINNNVQPLKAVGTFGAFDVSAGTFAVDANANAYFADVAAIQAVRDTADVTLDVHLVKDNAGISFDIPLVTLGDGRPDVQQDQAITIPLSNQAATGAKVNSNLDHTLMMIFWDYLPTAAG